MEPVIIQKLDNDNATLFKAASIFVDAYYEDLKDISENKESLVEIFRNSLQPTHFYGAYVGNDLIGIFALSNENERAIRLDKKTIVKEVGAIKGLIVYKIMKNELESPIKMNKPGVYIEAVATDPAAQGRGVATQMMKYVITNNKHSELDVVDTNVNALHVYEKLGFKVYKEVKIKKKTGYSKKIFMEYDNLNL